jgi:outer membrane protease
MLLINALPCTAGAQENGRPDTRLKIREELEEAGASLKKNPGKAALPWTYPYALSVSTSAGILYGRGEENVYFSNIDTILYSQLLWDLKPLWYFGSALGYALAEPMEAISLFAELSVKAGIPGQTGVIEDRDWMAPNHGYSHFSVHDNFTQGALLADMNLGFSFPLWGRVLLKTGGWLSYMRFAWDAKDGYRQHAEGNKSYGSYELWDPSIPKVYIHGPALSYSVKWFIVSPGLSVGVPFLGRFLAGLTLTSSPFIWAAAEDVHHGSPDVQYFDYVSGGFFIEPRFDFSFSPHKRLDLLWYISYRHISGARGDTYTRYSFQSTQEYPDDVIETYQNQGGAGFRALDTGLSLKIRF